MLWIFFSAGFPHCSSLWDTCPGFGKCPSVSLPSVLLLRVTINSCCACEWTVSAGRRLRRVCSLPLWCSGIALGRRRGPELQCPLASQAFEPGEFDLHPLSGFTPPTLARWFRHLKADLPFVGKRKAVLGDAVARGHQVVTGICTGGYCSPGLGWGSMLLPVTGVFASIWSTSSHFVLQIVDFLYIYEQL